MKSERSKKVITWILLIIMLIGAIPYNAFASDERNLRLLLTDVSITDVDGNAVPEENGKLKIEKGDTYKLSMTFKEKRYPTSFKVDFVGEPYEGACYYRITRCPICAYTEKLGVAELMPLFCELDDVMISLQHGVLHRKDTIANGADCCDYFITGDRE